VGETEKEGTLDVRILGKLKSSDGLIEKAHPSIA